jgi:hypothetical protein
MSCSSEYPVAEWVNEHMTKSFSSDLPVSHSFATSDMTLAIAGAESAFSRFSIRSYSGNGSEKRNLSELKFRLFGADIGVDGAVDRVVELLEHYEDDDNDWDYSDTDQVQQFHSALIAAASRSDLPEEEDVIVLPESILFSFVRIYRDCIQHNYTAYFVIINDPDIITMMQRLWSACETEFPLTETLHHAHVHDIELLNLYAEQPEVIESLFTPDFVRRLCRAIITILTQCKAKDMSAAYGKEFVDDKRPLLKLLLRNVCKRDQYWNNLTAADRDNVMKWMPVWFWEDGTLAKETALSLELDVIQEEMKQAIEIHAELLRHKSEEAAADKAAAAVAARKTKQVVAIEPKAKKKRQSQPVAAKAEVRTESKPAVTGFVSESAKSKKAKSVSPQVQVNMSQADGLVRVQAAAAMPFKCDTCPASFPESQQLTSHSRRHGNRNNKFTCFYCDYGAANPAAVTAHMLIHGTVLLMNKGA